MSYGDAAFRGFRVFFAFDKQHNRCGLCYLSVRCIAVGYETLRLSRTVGGMDRGWKNEDVVHK